MTPRQTRRLLLGLNPLLAGTVGAELCWLRGQGPRIGVTDFGAYTPEEARRVTEAARFNRKRVLRALLGDDRALWPTEIRRCPPRSR
jgi:hypothetical protein